MAFEGYTICSDPIVCTKTLIKPQYTTPRWTSLNPICFHWFYPRNVPSISFNIHLHGGFLKRGGTPSHHPFPDGIFPLKHHPASGCTPSCSTKSTEASRLSGSAAGSHGFNTSWPWTRCQLHLHWVMEDWCDGQKACPHAKIYIIYIYINVLHVYIYIYNMYIYLNSPLVHKNLYHFFPARLSKMCSISEAKTKGARICGAWGRVIANVSKN